MYGITSEQTGHRIFSFLMYAELRSIHAKKYEQRGRYHVTKQTKTSLYSLGYHRHIDGCSLRQRAFHGPVPGYAMITAAWRGNDLVTLFVAVPLLIAGMIFARRGSLQALLIWMGMLGYSLYNYIFYLYGAAFNKCFLVYVALFSLSIYALIFGLGNININALGGKFSSRTPARWISGYMLFFALMLGGIEVSRALSIFFTGQVHEDIIKTGHPTGVVYATDLSILIPGLIVAAVFLWKRRPWGYVITTILMSKATTYALALIAMSWFELRATGAGDALLPLWMVLGAGCLVSWLSCWGTCTLRTSKA